MFTLTDTHCHLDFDQFNDDRQAVSERAWKTGVQRILIPEVHLDSFANTITLAESDKRIFLAVGVHPNSADCWNEQSLRKLRENATHPRVRAIGEIGLDYYRHHTAPALQKRILIDQLHLAAELDKPVILHCRDAFDDLMTILLDWLSQLPNRSMHIKDHPGTSHSFGGTIKQADLLIKAGFLLGINGSITFKSAEETRSVAHSVGIDNLLLETDAPYITPIPYRGMRNEPANILYINNALATVLGLTAELCAKMTYNNASKVFLW